MLELTACYPSHRGGRAKGSAADYSNKFGVRQRARDDRQRRGSLPSLRRYMETEIPERALGRRT